MRLRTIGLLAILALGLLAVSLPAEAQPATKVYRIGVLGTVDSPPWQAFRQALGELGYVEGRNVVIEWRWSEGKMERWSTLAADLVSLKPDVIVAAGGPGPRAVKPLTGAIPIVMTNHPDPVGLGLVASLARPGGNITGLSMLTPEIVGKQLELLREVVPSVTRVAVLGNPGAPSHPVILKEAEAAARSLGLKLQILSVRSPEDFEAAFAAIKMERAGALLVPADTMFFAQRTRPVELAARKRLPAIYGVREHAEAGGLMVYTANFAALFRRAATYVDKILKGAKPADLPVEQPTRFELIINLKTAKALGLAIPQSVLIRADEVIQ